MSLISLNFFIFFLIVFLVYYLLPGKLQWIWLLLASSYFYYKNASITQCLIFIIFLALNYTASLYITDDHKNARLIFRSILAFDVLMLMGMKYAGFFYEIISWLASCIGITTNDVAATLLIDRIGTLCPPRISYFSLIVIGYITDVYWGNVAAQKNPGKFILFSSYFPQMTSGPIVQYEQVENELWGNKHHFSYNQTVRGLERILFGVFKKLVVSERLSVMVNEIYNNYEIYPGFYIWFAAACFSLQLYSDFSGLMDIVLGFSELLGITLPENFDTPFYSTSLAEFWRRWHITLGGFLKSYVFYAIQQTESFRKLRKFCKKKLGKGYEKKYNIPQFLGLLISWFLIGLWHGGGFNYIFGVGIYMGIIIILSELCQPLFKLVISALHINTDTFSYTLFMRLRTFIIFIFGLSFFRANTLTSGFRMWRYAFSRFNPWIFFDHSIYALGLDESEFHILLFSLLIMLVVSIVKQKGSVREQINKQNFLFRLIIFVALFVMIITWGYYGTSYNAGDFIYGKF